MCVDFCCSFIFSFIQNLRKQLIVFTLRLTSLTQRINLLVERQLMTKGFRTGKLDMMIFYLIQHPLAYFSSVSLFFSSSSLNVGVIVTFFSIKLFQIID